MILFGSLKVTPTATYSMSPQHVNFVNANALDVRIFIIAEGVCFIVAEVLCRADFVVEGDWLSNHFLLGRRLLREKDVLVDLPSKELVSKNFHHNNLTATFRAVGTVNNFSHYNDERK